MIPEISVLMTAYNRSHLINDSIRSVLSSTHTNLELIICDDSSLDATVDVVKDWAERDSRIVLYVNESNLGDYPNRNKAASLARGEYILYVDSDDVIESNAIEYVLRNFRAHPEAHFSVIYPYGDILDPRVLSPLESIKRHFYINGFLNTGPGALVFRREFFLINGSYSLQFGPANDAYSHIRFAASGKALLLPYRYLHYKSHQGQESYRKEKYYYLNQQVIRALMTLSDLPLSAAQRRSILARQSRKNLFSILRLFLKNRSWRSTLEILRHASFRWSDFSGCLIFSRL